MLTERREPDSVIRGAGLAKRGRTGTSQATRGPGTAFRPPEESHCDTLRRRYRTGRLESRHAGLLA